MPPAREIDRQTREAYWRETSRLTWWIVALWAVSWVVPLLLHYQLNKIVVFGFPLSFWFAGQGSLAIFIVLIVYYAVRMNQIDQKYGVQEDFATQEGRV
jgi:putative solute:sodium symporter small subunit